MTNLVTLHEIVWDFRAQAESYWPTPNPQDALCYAFTEAGEAMDAYLREHRPGDARNSERQSTVEEELADCAIMLLTALGPELQLPKWYGKYQYPEKGLHEICVLVGETLRGAGVKTVFLALDAMMGFLNLATMIPQRLARIRARHRHEMRENLLRIRMRKAAELASEIHDKTYETTGDAGWFHAARAFDYAGDLLEAPSLADFWNQVEERMQNLTSLDFIPNQDGGLREGSAREHNEAAGLDALREAEEDAS